MTLERELVGKNRYKIRKSVLRVFVAGCFSDWNVTSKAFVAEGDFPNDKTTSDHRPLLAIVGG
jgi:hypothetical protein